MVSESSIYVSLDENKNGIRFGKVEAFKFRYSLKFTILNL